MIEAALGATGGRVAGPHGAAVKFGIPHQPLDSKITALRIERCQFKERGRLRRKCRRIGLFRRISAFPSVSHCLSSIEIGLTTAPPLCLCTGGSIMRAEYIESVRAEGAGPRYWTSMNSPCLISMRSAFLSQSRPRTLRCTLLNDDQRGRTTLNDRPLSADRSKGCER